ncbi:YceI family protein [Ancylobacter pratisalsi]|uniref:YceI family protein n=1 Tax=Ancylobacter pratisalsi TaxID=1745854 RepID=A0A6P1YJW6_9HYPH|nr:YceI family protein [Ancylobacter pratisalsi]QIB33405.1 YceI family protein [Ancylobacter pratisalsi]
MLLRSLLAAVLLLGIITPSLAQQLPGTADTSRISGGTYAVDANHTQVTWTVDHLGITPLSGMFAATSGTLVLDPAHPETAQLNVTVPISSLAVTSQSFGTDLAGPEFFDTATFPTATFASTRVKPDGMTATVEGDLTLHGITRPVTLEVTFFGAGVNPRSKRENVGFTATGRLKRSDFGLGLAVPVVSDAVSLSIVGAFEKRP